MRKLFRFKRLRRGGRSRVGNAALFVVMIALSVLMIAPLVYSVINSFKPLDELFAYPPRFFVVRPTMENYSMLFKLVANMTDGYLAVAEGKADVCICSTASAQLYADANGGLSIPDYRFDADPNMNGTCVAMPQEGTESLAEVVNECIAELKDAGSIESWYGEYQTAAAELGIE